MSTHKETRLVHCYDPVAFVIAVEQGVKDGFSLDLVTPEHYPQQIGFQFICTMVKDAEKEVKNPQKAQEEVLTIKVDASEVQAVVDKAVEEVKTLVEAHEAQQTTEGTQEQSEAVVEAPKKAETATQDVKAKPGRPAKAK